MEVDMKSGQIGPETNYSVKVDGQKLIVSFNHQSKMLKSTNVQELDLGAVLDALKDAIPGNVDNVVIDTLKAALLSPSTAKKV